MRINRYFTDNGICSRREADRLIQEGKVKINDRIAVLGDQLKPEDKVYLNNKEMKCLKSKDIVILYNKPRGIECTSDPDVQENIIRAVNYPERLFHIGRLDKMSEGLILLTNIGDLVNAVLRKKFCHEKEYMVWLNDKISPAKVNLLRAGIDIGDGKTLPCKIKKLKENQLLITLTEGRNRQIRRMAEAVGLRVVRLKRIRFMHLKVDGIKKGTWRDATPNEFSRLIEDSKIDLGPHHNKNA